MCLASCGPLEANNTTTVPSNQTSAPAIVTPAAPEALATSPNQPSEKPLPPSQSGPVWEQSNGSLAVRLFTNPEVTVNAAELVIQGQAPAETVISIEDTILVVDQSQSFAFQVNLEEGANVFELVASDINGQEVSFILTITYEQP